MRRSRRPIVIASRRSPLARVQAETIGNALSQLHPGIAVEYVWIESEGDRSADAVLANLGGKGLFVRAIEKALLQHKADIAVHSMKDLPANPLEVTQGLVIAAVPPRADARDCLISRHAVASIAALPPGATVGTSSPRRGAQLRRLRSDLHIAPLRGNIETRLRRVLVDGVFDATLLAVAGLERGGLGEHAARAIPVDEVLPAAGQGAIAVQCRGDDHVTLRRCLPLNHAATAQAVHAERQIVAAMHGDCHSSLAVHCATDGVAVRLTARVLSPDGSRVVEADDVAKSAQIGRMVKGMIAKLKTDGAQALLRGA